MRPTRRAAIVFTLSSFVALACGASSPRAVAPPLPALDAREISASFSASTPEEQGIDSNALCDLTEWARDDDAPIFSILISRNGKLVYEMYTSSLGRDEAHYLMSVTKSFTSAIVGIALDEKILPSTDAHVADLFPASLFASEADRARFANVSLKDVLGMSALDAQVPPHLVNDETKSRQHDFIRAPNRAKFALSQRLLPEPGRSYQYTDITPLIATGALSYATKGRAFDFAEAHLFGPLGFQNTEWMHEDATGIDNGAYGLRVRPIDMQKFGNLFLSGGAWNGQQVISRAWVDQSFTPWIHSNHTSHTVAHDPAFDYGWYWWQNQFGPWTAHVANGWKGQRIAIVKEEQLVVTMTADIEKGEEKTFARVMEFVRNAVKNAPLPASPEGNAKLRARLAEARATSRITGDMEKRMVPSVAPKEKHVPFSG